MELTLVQGDDNTLELNETSQVLQLEQPSDAVIEVHETEQTVLEVTFAGGGGSGTPGADGKSAELRVDSGFIQWRQTGGEWQNLISVDSLVGETGSPGTPGTDGADGADGKSVELQASATHIQWRLVGDTVWTNLISISDLRGLNSVIELASDEFVHDVRITNDGTGSGTWPERLVFRYRDTTGGTYFRTGYFNEYGELRVAPAKNNTVALRLFQKELSSQPARNMTIPLMDVMDNRDDRNVLFALMPDGTVQARNVQSKTVCVPEGTTGWESQPDGTLWVEYGD